MKQHEPVTDQLLFPIGTRVTCRLEGSFHGERGTVIRHELSKPFDEQTITDYNVVEWDVYVEGLTDEYCDNDWWSVGHPSLVPLDVISLLGEMAE